jgi:hypothetical protein
MFCVCKLSNSGKFRQAFGELSRPDSDKFRQTTNDNSVIFRFWQHASKNVRPISLSPAFEIYKCFE